ncbi:MAG: glycosyltransferase [Lentisphaeria bacterium]|nr:glycosyltransferase [Lentisphaeria bacterium]
MKLAPVVLFCYTRLRYLKRVISALQKNAEAGETVVFFYSDGGKDDKSWAQVYKVRDYIRTIQGFKDVVLVEQTENKRLEFNVIQGITEVVSKFGRVIVLEDDILPSKYFLKFMNDSLDFYQDRKEVMCVSAYNFLNFPKDFPETFAWRLDGGLGWCTWKDRWLKFRYFNNRNEAIQNFSDEELHELEFGGVFPCLKCLDTEPATWDISWYICVFLNGVSISTTHSLTCHIGIEGTHSRKSFLRRFVPGCYSPVRFSNQKVSFLTSNVERNMTAESFFEDYQRKFCRMTFFEKMLWCLSYFCHRVLCRVDDLLYRNGGKYAGES